MFFSGVVYHFMEDFERAQNYYRRALDMDPSLHETRKNLKKLVRQAKTNV